VHPPGNSEITASCDVLVQQRLAGTTIGENEPFDAVPFFWSAHYDTQVLYVGHAETWDTVQIDG
jgi:hypothetical protein